jgi:hypothetical protein
MEEILASIRRIISEDEASTEQPPRSASASQEDEEDHLELVEGEADDKIIHDIARVLSGGAPGPVEDKPAAEESAADEILDLTAELGGLEPVETLELEIVEELEITELQPDEPPLELEPEPEPEPLSLEAEAPAGEPEPMALEAETPFQPVPARPAPAPVSMEPPQRKLSASEEAASALERAIAALRAGQVPTSAPPPTPNYMSASGPAPQPAPPPPLFGAEPQATPGFIPQPSPVPGFIPPQLASEPEPEAELELVLTEFEVETTETLVMDIVADDELSAEPEEPVATPEFQPYQPDYMSPLTNGSGPHEELSAGAGLPAGSDKAIEESIKDILRPMLQQWLDENMARVVTAALKDEIRNDPARFQRD